MTLSSDHLSTSECTFATADSQAFLSIPGCSCTIITCPPLQTSSQGPPVTEPSPAIMSEDSRPPPPADDRPLSFSSEELLKHLDVFTKRFESTQTELAASIRNEVTAVVAPLQASQREIIDELETTRNKFSEIALDNADTKAQVENLQQQMLFMEQRLSNSNGSAPPQESIGPPFPPRTNTHPPLISQSQDNPVPRSNGRVQLSALDVLQSAKKILGFSPITTEDISYLKADHGTVDDMETMRIAIIEFLNCEMKVPKSVTENLVIRRIFPPAKQPSGWKTLYAEFQDSSTADLINQYVTNLLPGKSVSIYVPHSLFPRFNAIRDIEHSFRNGEIKHKTKVKYGSTDFVLLVKPRGSSSPWSYVPLTSLPPLQLSSFDGNPSTSPPPGRTRLSSKRSRPESPGSLDNTRSSKAKLDDAHHKSANDDIEDKDTEETEHAAEDSVDETPKTPTKATHSMLPRPDLGAFGPSACLSPSAAFNQNFTFATTKSSIPKMSNLNC